MRRQLAQVLDDLVVRAQLARLEHADRQRPLSFRPEGAATLGSFDSAAAEANQLGSAPDDGPAATLFAFGRRAHLFPQAHRSMTFLLTAAQARRVNKRLAVGDRELERMLERLADSPGPGFLEVRAWLTPHLMPRSDEEDERLPLRAAV
jgi:hypothetical protein